MKNGEEGDKDIGHAPHMYRTTIRGNYSGKSLTLVFQVKNKCFSRAKKFSYFTMIVY